MIVSAIIMVDGVGLANHCQFILFNGGCPRVKWPLNGA